MQSHPQWLGGRREPPDKEGALVPLGHSREGNGATLLPGRVLVCVWSSQRSWSLPTRVRGRAPARATPS